MIIYNPMIEEWNDETWRQVIMNVIKLTAMQHENSEDIVAGGWALGLRRAELFDRQFWPGEDVIHPLCIFCWWPFKPAMLADSMNYLRSIRWELFKGVYNSPIESQRLLATVPDELLRVDTQELFSRLRQEPASSVIQLQQSAG